MNMRLGWVVSLLLVGCLVVACADSEDVTPAPTPVRLAGTTWKAVSVAGRATVPGSEPTIAFDAGSISGTGGCNQVGGTYLLVGGVLTFGETSMTLMGCREPIASIESAFMAALARTTTASLDGDGRLNLDGPVGRIVLTPLVP